jgi:hypothetical protein
MKKRIKAKKKEIVIEEDNRQAIAVLLLAVTIFALFLILFIHLSSTPKVQQASIVGLNESEDFQKQIYTRPTTVMKVIYNKR